jgi:hypothetical protein
MDKDKREAFDNILRVMQRIPQINMRKLKNHADEAMKGDTFTPYIMGILVASKTRTKGQTTPP